MWSRPDKPRTSQCPRAKHLTAQKHMDPGGIPIWLPKPDSYLASNALRFVCQLEIVQSPFSLPLLFLFSRAAEESSSVERAGGGEAMMSPPARVVVEVDGVRVSGFRGFQCSSALEEEGGGSGGSPAEVTGWPVAE